MTKKVPAEAIIARAERIMADLEGESRSDIMATVTAVAVLAIHRCGGGEGEKVKLLKDVLVQGIRKYPT